MYSLYPVIASMLKLFLGVQGIIRITLLGRDLVSPVPAGCRASWMRLAVKLSSSLVSRRDPISAAHGPASVSLLTDVGSRVAELQKLIL